MKRRELLKMLGAGAAGLAASKLKAENVPLFSSKFGKIIWGRQIIHIPVPSYLKDYAELCKYKPHEAAMKWFKEAKFGMFIHFGLYSILGRGEWVQYNEKIRPAQYALLKDEFTAENFDADLITDLALEAGMKYINITTRHHDCFCLFDTKQTEFNSVKVIGRDLVAELAEKCREKSLGLFFYYSHGRDWKHPDSPPNGWPKYSPPEESYHYGGDWDLQRYVNFMSEQIKELLTNYGPVAGIWLDGIATAKAYKSQFNCQKLYDMIHKIQPNALVSYKTGLLGTEDFYAPERSTSQTGKQIELCNTLQPSKWGYNSADDGNHRNADWVMARLGDAANLKANLLLNTGPLADGTIHPEDVVTLKEVGRRLRENNA